MRNKYLLVDIQLFLYWTVLKKGYPPNQVCTRVRTFLRAIQKSSAPRSKGTLRIIRENNFKKRTPSIT